MEIFKRHSDTKLRLISCFEVAVWYGLALAVGSTRWGRRNTPTYRGHIEWNKWLFRPM